MNIDGLKDENGKLISYAWPGGYPIVYLDKSGEILCPASPKAA